MALTATASPGAQSLIQESLKMVRPAVVSLSLNRPNIYLSVSTVRSLDVSSCRV
jgi:superfamily II DNA helicase RecQ